MGLLQVSSWEVPSIERGEGRATFRLPSATSLVTLRVSGCPRAKHVIPLPSPGLPRPKERVCAVDLCVAGHMVHTASLEMDTGLRVPSPLPCREAAGRAWPPWSS